jgi:hypothetical protein
VAISVACGTVYGITAAILGLPYPLALAVIAGILDPVPTSEPRWPASSSGSLRSPSASRQ